ncbi:MAG: GspH/FimT family pseudopilin [Verrucomicrobiales bacterium]
MKLSQNQLKSKRALLGTSLVEVLLTLVLVLALISSVVISFSGTHAATALKEGAERFESLIQFARAEASLTGKKYRLVFTDNTNATSGATLKVASLEVESNPATEPGIFTKVTSAAVANAELDELIGVEAVKVPGLKKTPTVGDAEAAVASEDDASSEDELNVITFYPDGSSDSVEIILAPQDGEEKSRMAVRLSGITGTVSREFLEMGGNDLEFSDEDPFWDEETTDGTNKALISAGSTSVDNSNSSDFSFASNP